MTLHGPDGVVKTGPTAADLYGKPEGYYLDFPGNPLDPACSYEKLGRRWNGDRKPVDYAHIAHEPGRPDTLALQYWFYYVFNDWNNKHESDWEMIQLVFHAADAAAALETHPYEVAFSQHEGGERAAWDDTKLQKDGTHPIAYPGGGSHANYYSTAIWMGRSAQEGFGCDDTSPPSVRVQPTPILVPTGVDCADRLVRLAQVRRPLGSEGGRVQQRADGAVDQAPVAAPDRVAGAVAARLERADPGSPLLRPQRDRLLLRSRRGGLERAHLLPAEPAARTRDPGGNRRAGGAPSHAYALVDRS